jgi:hypothetical protein
VLFDIDWQGTQQNIDLIVLRESTEAALTFTNFSFGKARRSAKSALS